MPSPVLRLFIIIITIITNIVIITIIISNITIIIIIIEYYHLCVKLHLLDPANVRSDDLNNE